MNALKAIWEVQAGIVPDQPTLNRIWNYTSEDFSADATNTSGETIFYKTKKQAQDYYDELSYPGEINWAKLAFTWL